MELARRCPVPLQRQCLAAVLEACDRRWERYDGVGPAADVEPLLAEIDADPDGAFWGGAGRPRSRTARPGDEWSRRSLRRAPTGPVDLPPHRPARGPLVPPPGA